jgi:hypothetical protein
MEMSILTADGGVNVQAGWHEIPSSKPHVRSFWRAVAGLGHPLGASEGQVTDYQYVEHHCNGTVHDRPITQATFIAKGVKI